MLFARPEILAPIVIRGSTTRPIGRVFSDWSPVSTEKKSCPARIPDIKRVVVPLLPASKISSGSIKPFKPTPFTVRVSPAAFAPGSRVISTPNNFNICSVDEQSAPGEKFVIVAVEVFDRALNITALCETDLSPGEIISPRSERGRAIVTDFRFLLV